MTCRWARLHWNGGPSVLLLLPLLLLLWPGPAGADNASQAYYTALINVTVLSPERGGHTMLRIDRGRYGQDSPKVEVKGLLVAPVPINGVTDRQGCDPRTRFQVPPNTKQWIALLQRGNCTFKEKILRAASHNATAVVIYNNVSSDEPVTMTHQGKCRVASSGLVRFDLPNSVYHRNFPGRF